MVDQINLHQNLDAVSDQKSFLNKIIALQLSLTVLFYAVMFLVSEYYDQNRLDDFLSFKANDDPGFIQPSCIPRPIGIHYFGDFVSAACHSQLPSPYLSTFSSNYFPFAYVLMLPFGFLMRINFPLSVAIFLLTTCCLILLPIWHSLSFIRELANRTTLLVAVVIMSYPLFSVIDRGNIQGFVVGFVIIGLLSYKQDRKTMALFFLAAATSLKGYPFVFIFIFLRKQEWKHFVTALFVTFSLTVISLLSFSGGLYQNIKSLISKILELSDTGSSNTGYSNSMKALLDSVTELKIPLLADLSNSISNHYIFLFGTLAALCIFLSVQKKITDFDFIVIGAIFGTLLFDPSPGYVMLLYLVPLAEFFSNNHLYRDKKTRLCVLSICVLLVPKGIPIKTGAGWPRSDYSPTFNSFLNPLIQVLLLLVILCSFVWKQKCSTASSVTERS